MYLLGSQQVADLFSRDKARPIFAWLDRTQPGASDLFVSVVSLGMLANMVESLDPTERGSWRRLLASGRRSFAKAGGIVDVDLAAVDVWAGQLRGVDLTDEDPVSGERFLLGEDERLVIATAIARKYSLVTRSTPLLEEICSLTTLTFVEP